MLTLPARSARPTCDMPERRQVIDLPAKRLWVTEHRVEEKHCPVCSHLIRASFRAAVSAPTQYGTGIQTLATYLVEGQCVPYARASQLLHELLGVQLSAGSIASFVTTCHKPLAEVESNLKAALVKTNVIHQDETGLRVAQRGGGSTSARPLDSPTTPLIPIAGAKLWMLLALLPSFVALASMMA